jgi:branched-chain amino acid transport system substrate-binding protein
MLGRLLNLWIKTSISFFVILISVANAAEIRIGYTSDLSAANKNHSNALGLGLDTYFSYINNHGGIHEQPITLVAIDNAGDLKLLASSLKKLMQADVKLIITNPLPLPGSELLIKKFSNENAQIIFGKNLDYTKDAPVNYIAYKPGYKQEVKALIDFAMVNKKAKYDEIAIYVDNGPYAKDCAKVAVNYLKGFGATDEAISLVNESDLQKAQPLIANLNKDKIKAMLLCAKPQIIPEFVAMSIKTMPQTLYMALSYANTSDFAKKIAAASNGILVIQNVPSYKANIPAAIEYRNLFAALYPEEVMSSASFEGFILAKIIVAAMLAANATNDVSSLLAGLNSFDSIAIGLDMPLVFSRTIESTGITHLWYTKIIDNNFVDTKY